MTQKLELDSVAGSDLTAGAAPSAAEVFADTGNLAVGTYDIDAHFAAMDTAAVGKGCVVAHRNAADDADVKVLGGCGAPGQGELRLRGYVIATAGESIVIRAGSAAGAASSLYVGSIAVKKVR